eukprot:SAG31_NODE_742_length_12424_cov_16.082353_6_plen_253_part_00
MLGTVDKPSLHDITRDFTMGMHTANDLQAGHRHLITILRESRPIDVHGVPQWDSAAQNPATLYVDQYAEEHIKQGFCIGRQVEDFRIDTLLEDLFLDAPQDDLVFAGARCVGVEKLTRHAEAAEAKGDWWRAATTWALVRRLRLRIEGPGGVREPVQKTLAALDNLEKSEDGQLSALADSMDTLRFEQLLSLCMIIDLDTLMKSRDTLTKLLQTNVAKRNPVDSAVLRNLVFGIPDFLTDNVKLGRCVLACS